MKVVIIEGTDNSGKNTLISGLLDHYKTATVIHCDKPPYIDNSVNDIYQDMSFFQIAIDIINKKYNTDIVILNRSWIGEYIYGCLYRFRKDADVLDMIFKIERALIESNIDVKYIQLMSNYECYINNDDGKSISYDRDIVENEIKRFERTYRSSILDKKMIYVNEGKIFGNTSTFRDKKEILYEALNFIDGIEDNQKDRVKI